MDRRAFISAAGANLLAILLHAEAQTAERVYQVGFVTLGAPPPRRSRLLDAFIDAMRGKELAFAPYPVHAWLTAKLRGAALAAGRTDLISLWSGQGAPLLKHRRARELFASLVREADGVMG